MVHIKYKRLSSSDFVKHIPIIFLRQQVFLVSLVVASSLLFIFTQLFLSDLDRDETSQINDINYAVIVDCGSSGTRAHIFKWSGDPKVEPINYLKDGGDGKSVNKHIVPGLSSYKDEPEKASDYMEPIMDFIDSFIPKEKHVNTPIYFLATAGLRLLKDTTQKKILNAITRSARAKYNFPRVKSQVITGTDEGIYSWLSINKNRRVYNTDSRTSRPYGMIEMGGASLQVTFEIDSEVDNMVTKELKDSEAIKTFKNEQVSLKLGSNNTVKLFSTTFLGLGVNSARDSAIDLLLRDQVGVGNDFKASSPVPEAILKDPCLPSGAIEQLQRPTAVLRYKDRSIGYVIRENEETFEVRLSGSGDFLTCMSLLERVLKIAHETRLNCPAQINNDSKNNNMSCPMSLLGTNFIPFSHYEFIGLSEMFFTTNEMMHSAGLFDRHKILQETKRICSTEFNKLREMYQRGQVTWEDRVLHECFKAAWLLTILDESGLKMPSNYNKFHTLEALDGMEIDWTMGAIIKEMVLT